MLMVTESIKREILRLDAEGKSPKQIRLALGLTKGTVAGALYRHKQDNARVSDTPSNVVNLFALPKPQIVKRAENEQTDIREWRQRLKVLFKLVAYVKLAHLNDLHLPAYDSRALELWFQIMERFQPHIVVVGSDMLD